MEPGLITNCYVASDDVDFLILCLRLLHLGIIGVHRHGQVCVTIGMPSPGLHASSLPVELQPQPHSNDDLYSP